MLFGIRVLLFQIRSWPGEQKLQHSFVTILNVVCAKRARTAVFEASEPNHLFFLDASLCFGIILAQKQKCAANEFAFSNDSRSKPKSAEALEASGRVDALADH